MILLLLICCTIAFIVVSTTLLRLHPFLALILAALGFGLVSGMEPGRVVESINTGFGQTLGEIGVVILAGTIIGTFLEKSGGALSIADGAIRLTGKKHVPLALGLTGYIVLGRKLTHLLRRCKILKSSCIRIHCGFKIFCSLYMGKFTANHGFRSGTI
jgi:H+/gluconate symporter-like permease